MTRINTKASGKKAATKKITIKKASKKLYIVPKTEVENRYKVPVRLWKGFGLQGQKVFNGTMDQSIKNQQFINNPKAPVIPEEQWKTICWNMSCCAAWEAKKL